MAFPWRFLHKMGQEQTRVAREVPGVSPPQVQMEQRQNGPNNHILQLLDSIV